MFTPKRLITISFLSVVFLLFVMQTKAQQIDNENIQNTLQNVTRYPTGNQISGFPTGLDSSASLDSYCEQAKQLFSSHIKQLPEKKEKYMDVYNQLLSKLNDPEIQEKLLQAGVDRASLEADLKEFEALINKFETHLDSAIEEAQGLVNIDCQPGAINNAIQLLKPHSETLMTDAKEIRTFYIENLRPYVRQLMEYYKISPTPTP